MEENYTAVIAHRKQLATHRLLKDEALNDFFLTNGYVIIPNLLTTEEVQALRNWYEQYFETGPGMYVSHTGPDYNRNKQTSEKIYSIQKRGLDEYLTPYRQMVSLFAAKRPGGGNAFKLHQDWCIADEANYAIAQVWIALADLTANDGTLIAVPGSHLYFHNHRSGSCGIKFLEHDARFNNIIKTFEVKAGTAVLYHPSLFHGSLDNHSTADRLATITAVCHPEASLLYYHKNGTTLETYELTDEDLFSRLEPLAQGALPKGKLLHTEPNFHNINDDITEELFINRYQNQAHAN